MTSQTRRQFRLCALCRLYGHEPNAGKYRPINCIEWFNGEWWKYIVLMFRIKVHIIQFPDQCMHVFEMKWRKCLRPNDNMLSDACLNWSVLAIVEQNPMTKNALIWCTMLLLQCKQIHIFADIVHWHTGHTRTHNTEQWAVSTDTPVGRVGNILHARSVASVFGSTNATLNETICLSSAATMYELYVLYICSYSSSLGEHYANSDGGNGEHSGVERGRQVNEQMDT